ncbi:DNA ligase-like domain-containing protein [Streptomyces chartreusis]|uniref:hypothetical protein n=1 Tax=Streptomyces chartreusis TaxID=1969 RepID=UPI00363F8A40
MPPFHLPVPLALARAVTAVPESAGWSLEPKWNRFRALVSIDAGRMVLHSRRGTEMAPSFPEVVAGAVQLPDATALDGVM